MKQIFPALLALLPLTASAETIPFDTAWKEQGFLRLFSNDYIAQGNQLDVLSDGTVSLFWRTVPARLQNAQKAQWSWQVTQGVPPTDLSQKGGDDRNLALYFAFTTTETAQRLGNVSAARLLRDENTTALVYVWGGTQAEGSILNSPYHPRLKTIVLQKGQTGRTQESVNLIQDYQKAFGRSPEALVGLGVSADSDDTDGKIEARLQNLTLD